MREATPRKMTIKGSVFFASPDSLKTFTEKCFQLLHSLKSSFPDFHGYDILKGGSRARLAPDLSDLDVQIREVAFRKTEHQDLIINTADTEIGPNTRNRIGFRMTFYLERQSASNKPLEISIQGNSDSPEPSGVTSIHVADVAELGKARIVKIMEAMVLVCGFRIVRAFSLDFQSAVALPGDMYSGGWLTYFEVSSQRECLLRLDCAKPVGNGVLIETTSHIPDTDDEADLIAGRCLREKLDELGLVWYSTYAINGWPPDEEEWRYEEFISGAPRGRKYRVHCIDFDGYDSQRNVLLYAKLFRRLRHQRKEWGLRGWDGPVLNEAKRQVRAANGTQIEWHIGLEEPAARVRTLLADYTDFTESQLNVIYTPLSQALAGR
jgi:hypothetical protein